MSGDCLCPGMSGDCLCPGMSGDCLCPGMSGRCHVFRIRAGWNNRGHRGAKPPLSPLQVCECIRPRERLGG